MRPYRRTYARTAVPASVGTPPSATAASAEALVLPAAVPLAIPLVLGVVNMRSSPRVPHDARLARPAAVVEGRVGHPPQIVRRPPPEQELGLGVVQPRGTVGRADV